MNMKPTSLLALAGLLALAAIVCSGIEVPSIGVVEDRAGVLRPILGVPGSFLLGDPLPSDTARPGTVAADLAWIDADSVVLQTKQGPKRFDAPGASSLFVIGPTFIGARSDTTTYAIRIEPGKERLYVLPEAQAPNASLDGDN